MEWSLHNPKEDLYVWNNIADLEHFLRLAIVEDLLVILRPGPYICAERDFVSFIFTINYIINLNLLIIFLLKGWFSLLASKKVSSH